MPTQQLGILDITNEEYFAIPALSNSGMKDLAVSPLRFWHLHVNPKRSMDDEETTALRMGSALHCAVLEGFDVLESRYFCELKPDDNALVTVDDLRAYITSKGDKPKGSAKLGLACQARDLMDQHSEYIQILMFATQIHAEKHAGKTKLSTDEFSRIEGMASALRAEPVIQDILSQGRAEVPMVVQDPETGVLLKCKLDWMAPKVTLDLKSFVQKRGASIDKSVADAIFYEGYNRQAYTYEFIRNLVTGEKTPFTLGFVESVQPHETRIKVLTPRSQYEGNLYWEQARVEVRSLIRLYAECLDKFGDKPWRVEQVAEPLVDDDIRQLAF